MKRTIDELLQIQYWIIDILPEQVPEDSTGQYFSVEKYYLAPERFLNILLDDAMILSEPDDTHMTIFNPDEKLLTLVKAIAAGEGLFVWQPQNRI